MAQQTINIGAAANDGSGDTIREGFNKTNQNETELYNRVGALEGSIVTAASLIRANYSVMTDGTENQRIPYSSEFVTNYSLVLMDFNQGGVEVVPGSEDSTGFNINSLSVFAFGYLAGIEV